MANRQVTWDDDDPWSSDVINVNEKSSPNSQCVYFANQLNAALIKQLLHRLPPTCVIDRLNKLFLKSKLAACLKNNKGQNKSSENGCVCSHNEKGRDKWQHSSIAKQTHMLGSLPWGETPCRPCGSRTGPLPPPGRSWNTHRRSRFVPEAKRLGESWSNTDNISWDHTRTTLACTPLEAPCRTVCSSTRTVWRPAPSLPRLRPRPPTWSRPSWELCRSLSRCHPPLRSSFRGVSSSCSVADAHSGFHPHDYPSPAQGIMGDGVRVRRAGLPLGGGVWQDENT